MIPLVVFGAVVVAAVLGVVLARRRFIEVTVSGTSMSPALATGERVLVRRASVGRLRRGDVVVVRCTPPGFVYSGDGADHMVLIKRVTAVAGDPVPEDVAAAAGVAPGSPVPEGRFVLHGDNAEGSLDSRECGFFAADDLVGIMTAHKG